ncbi:YciI family protein [Mucilaginibacter panaciglaebae]|uniref:YCII-related domain-containing protein n=1 Tax=Mucilaginibacter panaciglaebae TaxID=502331 RepID=A0ABP7WH20_9SPHI
MIKTLFTFLLSAIFIGAHAQDATKANQGYDAALAKKLGADEYGMHKYIMAFLKTGPVNITDNAQLAFIQKGHLKNIMRLADEGKLVVAGPFMDDQPIEGIFIFNVATIEEARALTETDPAIKAGVLAMELRPFYCSAALQEVAGIHKKIAKKSPAE